ncbi:MAG: nitrogenase molybdenum-iron protein subunit beta [Actinobacteria bacterium]|nr:nitrogenase molybdenum-iron protein subunit beta [Actinomycetota bacterium]
MVDIAECPDIERQALAINPAKTCQPIGAVYAALGIHGCMPHSHGSQGCASYLRMHLSRHFREPIITTTSSFTEGQVVFGGSGNLKMALKNLIHIYKPEVVGVHTTCSAETIGDDVPGIVEEMRRAGELPEDVKVFCASTPSYVGSHITGFANMVKAAVDAFAENGEAAEAVNVLPGFVSPSDAREIKRILKIMGTEVVVLPDVSGVIDAPMTGELKLYQEGGTKIEEIERMGASKATIALGREAGNAAGMALATNFQVPLEVLPVPIGIDNVDALLMRLSAVMGKPIPKELEEERGRLVDMMLDAHAHWYGKKVAIFGDPDVTEALTGFCVSMGMEPEHVLTGTRSKDWKAAVTMIAPKATVVDDSDLFMLHRLIKRNPVDLLIGNSYGKYIARSEGIPLIRVGFPITDRANLQHFPVVGYAGTAWLVERIGNTLLDWKEDRTPDYLVELIQ